MSDHCVKETQLAINPYTATLSVKAKPFIKWAGGKWQLLTQLVAYFPPIHKINRYYEPFLGGGAVYFHIQHPNSFLSDNNPELIELYQIVRDDVETLITHLKFHYNDKAYYYQLRAQDVKMLTSMERAARFIFLNKTCYNGLYRVNSKMQFNVPFGYYKQTTICDVSGLRSASLALKLAKIDLYDFNAAVSEAATGDFIYFDPPYHPISKTSSFTSYTAQKFDDKEQSRLADVVKVLNKIGCYVMLSNSNSAYIRELYNGFRIIEIKASRAINSKGDGRGKITELVILNY